MATDAEVLSRVLALKLVAQTRSETIGAEDLATIREALLDEEWSVALATWIQATGVIVDAYPDDEIWTDARLDIESTLFELRLAPIFEEGTGDGEEGRQPPQE